MSNSTHNGILYVVATPIGNLADMTNRGIEVLRHADYIVVEDSRHSAKLLQHYNISSPTYVLHDHNERENSTHLVQKLQQGCQVALISDAGTPLISDPGYWLVNLAISQGIKVVPVPGPSAVISALSVSGLPTDRFRFEGFLPAKAQARIQKLLALQRETATLIFYEAPHRIVDTLTNMVEVFGAERAGVITRELTKTFETVLRAPLGELLQQVKLDENQQKGELVILVHGAPPTSGFDALQVDELLASLLEELSVKKAAALAAKLTGEKKNRLYERALQLKQAQS